MNDCCLKMADEYFYSHYPLESFQREDFLVTHLLEISKRWGDLLSSSAEEFYIRSTSSPTLGIDAETGILECPTCGTKIRAVIIGARLFYFVWRVGMICATFWDTTERGVDRSILGRKSPDWPLEEHLQQLHIAVEMYFGTGAFLGTQGLEELNRQIFDLPKSAATAYFAIVDFAELWVLFHELQHHMQFSGSSAIAAGLQEELPITEKRAKNWSAELTHDADSLKVLIVSASSVLHESNGLSLEAAKIQAGVLACAGADAALHTIQLLEELKVGFVGAPAAATSGAFVRHPPSGYRRNALSNAGFSLLTGKSIESLLQGDVPESWRTVAQSVAGTMRVRDMLFERFHAWPKRKA